jgi:hypothetical protein
MDGMIAGTLARMSKPVRIGCSGWNYADWRERVYPRGVPVRRWLAHYATLFDTVEINSTFYRLAKPSAVENWVRDTPEDFVFAAKASQYLTHMKRLTNLGPGIERFSPRGLPARRWLAHYAEHFGTVEVNSTFYRLAKPAAGLLYRIANYLRETEGSAFMPLPVTSLVRPWSYQKRLMMSNANANTIRAGVPPTHVFGLAFDIPRAQMANDRERRLQKYLDTLADDGTIVYFKEGKAQATYHVIAMPAAHDELEADFYEMTARAGRTASKAAPLTCAGRSNPDFVKDEIWW